METKTFVTQNGERVFLNLPTPYKRDTTETLFIASYISTKEGYATLETATAHQDMYKHWDVKINGITFDVKKARKISRSDSDVQYDYTWVELRNVRGMGGWIVGEAEYIVFEQLDHFLVVDRIQLFELITKNLLPEVGKGPYERYQRQDRHDLITLVPIADICKLDSYTIPKFQ